MTIQRKGDYNSISAPIVGLCDCMETLLASCVPNLHVHTLPLYFYLFLLEIYPQRIDEGLMEIISDVTTH